MHLFAKRWAKGVQPTGFQKVMRNIRIPPHIFDKLNQRKWSLPKRAGETLRGRLYHLHNQSYLYPWKSPSFANKKVSYECCCYLHYKQHNIEINFYGYTIGILTIGN